MALGVQEYWIIDHFARTMTVVRRRLTPTGRVGSTALVVREAGRYRTPLLPGWELELGPLLAVADRWEQ